MRLTGFFIVPLAISLAACNNEEQPQSPALGKALAAGKAVVEANCFVCHGQGINGAPIIGNRKMWQPRLAQGKPVLIRHAVDGYGLMPAKGGNADLSEGDIELAIGYMLSQLPDSM